MTVIVIDFDTRPSIFFEEYSSLLCCVTRYAMCDVWSRMVPDWEAMYLGPDRLSSPKTVSGSWLGPGKSAFQNREFEMGPKNLAMAKLPGALYHPVHLLALYR